MHLTKIFMSTCKNCNINYIITKKDLAFYDKISPVFNEKKYTIPPPTLCPDCRQQRRLTFRNERSLYKRKCDLTGKEIVSLYSPDKKVLAYNTQDWWKDGWDGKDYSRDFDFERPFFDQFKELMQSVPEPALMNDDEKSSENCAYTNDFAYSKNCYLCFVSWYNEDCYYSTGIHYSKDTLDSLDSMNSQLIYECIDCNNCYNCAFLKYCDDCNDCFFGYDLKNCKNCFKCAGLRNKEYHIENKKYSKEEYEKIVNKELLTSYENFKKIEKEYYDFLSKVPHRALFNKNAENCIGNKLYNCKNVTGFENYECADSKYIYHCPPVHNCYDITNTGKAEFCYETVVSIESQLSLFTNECWNTNNSFYCNHCFHSNYLFGCTGLKKEKYCILNKQYTQEEYEALVPKIIEHMKQTGEWGEFFPIKISPFAYNETVAQEYFPLTKEEALEKEYMWKDADPDNYQEQENEIPDSIRKTNNSIIKETLACVKCGRNYKILNQELTFYNKLGLPLPRVCPMCRHIERLRLRNPRKLYERTCSSCNKKMVSTYSKTAPETVYCEDCYQKVID